MDFNPTTAKNILIENRLKYIEQVKAYLEWYLKQEGNGNFDKKDWEELASEIVITAGQELTRLNGSIQYLSQLEKDNDYPVFERILK